MHRLAVLALAALGLLPLAAAAQSPAPNYALCTLMDTGQVPAQVWASPVLESNAPAHDIEALNRLAGAFHRHVAGLGGAGTKNCVAMSTRAEAEAFREEQRALWDTRTFFVKAGNWHDVAWVPPADALVAASPAPAQKRYFRCHATTTDVPGLIATAWTVSSGVFEKSVPGDRALAAAVEQANSYREEFKPVAQAAGIPAEFSQCYPYDTRAEADKAEQDYRRLIGGFNTKYDVVGWVPSGKVAAASAAPLPTGQAANAGAPPVRLGIAIIPVSAELAQAAALGPPRGAWVAEVADGSLARRSGIQVADVVLEIAGQVVIAPVDVPAILARLRPGFEVPVRVWRAGGPHELKIVIPEA